MSSKANLSVWSEAPDSSSGTAAWCNPTRRAVIKQSAVSLCGLTGRRMVGHTEMRGRQMTAVLAPCDMNKTCNSGQRTLVDGIWCCLSVRAVHKNQLGNFLIVVFVLSEERPSDVCNEMKLMKCLQAEHQVIYCVFPLCHDKFIFH